MDTLRNFSFAPPCISQITFVISLFKAFKSNEIVPDVLSKPPHDVIHVKYEKSDKEVDFGKELTPTDVGQMPHVHYDADDESFYTLIMTDPDAPSRKNPIRREWHHWLVVNIPGKDVEKGETLSEYVPSAPPKNSGLHRYVFLVFKQPGKLTFDEPHKSNTDGNRGNFSTKKFAEKYKLGNPVAGNFFQAQYDDSVPAVHKQLGF